jgi:hypothetical protein
MSSSDNLNFRGKYKQYDADGKPYLYRIGDVVEHRGKKFVSVKATSNAVPGTVSGDSYWQKLAAGGGGFYIQETPPDAAVEGDRWYRPDVSVMFTLINQENNLIWVEL